MTPPNNFSIPVLGFGTYQLEGNDALRMVRCALDIGYRHIDTAQLYGNEAEVGQAILESGLPRAHVFVTTKIWGDRFTRQALAPSVDESLRKLNMEYVDLLLLHWPNPAVPLAETLEALMAVKAAGKTRSIGVSNFTTDLMRQAASICGEGVLVNNQVEYHPFLNQDRVIQQAHELGMSVTAYRPIAKGKIMQNDTLRRIAEKYNKTVAQITLRWITEQGIIAIPRTSQESHAQSNFDIFDFSLADEDMQAIHALRGNQRLVSPEGLAPQWDQPEPSLSH